MNKKRLLKLASLLEADAKDKKGLKFSLSTWGRAQDGTKPGMSCNTTACAVGLACISGAFKSAGLGCAPSFLKYGRIEPRCGRRTGWKAVRYVFGLESHEATFLFMDDSYAWDRRTRAIGERTVAKRIRDFVAGKVAP